MRLDQILKILTPIVGSNLQIRRIESALTNACYQLQTAEESWALRINNPQAHSLGIDRQRERAIINALGDANFIPVTLAMETDFLLTQWLNGTHPDMATISQLSMLISLVKRLHQWPTKALEQTRPLTIKQQLRHLTVNIALPAAVSKLLEDLLADYQPAAENCLCYHDWHAGNIIQSADGLRLLDWEYAALGDPLIDWACLCSGLHLNRPLTNSLLEQIGVNWARFRIAIALVELMATLWFNQRYPQRNWQAQYLSWWQRWRTLPHSDGLTAER